jgi:hypothetical protein
VAVSQAGSLKQATGALLAWIQRKVGDPSNIVLSMGIPRRLSGKGAWKASNLAVFKAEKSGMSPSMAQQVTLGMSCRLAT